MRHFSPQHFVGRAIRALWNPLPLIAGLLALAEQARPAGDFEFVVIGDTRPHFERDDFQNFESLIPKINGVNPAFVVNLGDLIYGYGPRRKEKQWDKYEQVIKAIHAPYHQVVGNHDVFSKEARKIYARRFGKFHESFDYGGCHFVLMDSCEGGRWGCVGPAELEWLKTDLKTNQAQSVFVFLHFPLWEPERIAPAYHDFWVETLHPLFRQSRVRAVFGGHFHSYGPTREFDGIRYFITGGGGAELRPNYKKAGGEHHFLKVRVSGDTVDVRVATSRGELTDAEADVTGGLQFADRHSSRIGIKQGVPLLRAGVNCSISLDNSGAETLEGKAEWIFDASAFSVEPRTVPIQVPPGATHRYAFTLKTLQDGAALQSLPRLEFRLAQGAHRFQFHRDIEFLQEVRAPYRKAPPDLDGQLADWDGIPLLHLGARSAMDPQLRALHDGETLYLAVVVPNVAADAKEEFAFSDDLQVGMAERLSETDFTGDFLRLGFSANARSASDRTPGRKKRDTVPGVKSICRIQGDRATYEIAIPVRLLKHLKAGKEGSLIVNLSFPVPDLEREGSEPSDPTQNSFSYQVRYGGEALTPIYFVELLLQPRK